MRYLHFLDNVKFTYVLYLILKSNVFGCGVLRGVGARIMQVGVIVINSKITILL